MIPSARKSLRVTITRIGGAYNGHDAHGWHILDDQRLAHGGGPWRSFEQAKARADALGLTVIRVVDEGRDLEEAREVGGRDE